ncbi:unnamed protein product [Amoebophrya sp. A25]|nr:unnamed protein product [Amoebophrya sp. A25]|eukprot:GSA25T00005848001.1
MDLSKWNMESFGDGHPFGDPGWYQGQYSPYYNESHKQLRKFVRDMCEEHVIPNANEWDEAKSIPKEVRLLFGKSGMNCLMMGHPFPVDYLPQKGKELPEFLQNVKLDGFHEMILNDEYARCGSGGVLWGMAGGLAIGLPPVNHFGSEELKRRILPEVLGGEKVICLAITEPTAGSDVAQIRCKAVREGDYYIVTGEKKWITNGVIADYFTTAVRTGPSGAGGISLLLIERGPGVKTRQMDCSGVWCSGTSYVTFDQVKVPVNNILGKENKGFKYIMSNFNHERMSICYMTNRFARVCLEESVKFANKRKTFGKKLVDHPVIRWKLAEMARMIESNQALLESLCYNLERMEKQEANLKLGGTTALAKVQCTKTMEFCAREAAQVFGGLSYTRGGQGEKVERLNREVRAMAVPGGSEEIMLDLGIRQSAKVAALARKMASAQENAKL